MRNEKGALHLEVLSAMPGRIRFQLEKPIKSDVPFLGIKGVTRCRYNPRIGTLLCEYDQLTATEEQLLVKIGAVYAGLVGTALLHIKHSEEEGFSMAPSGYLALCCIALDGSLTLMGSTLTRFTRWLSVGATLAAVAEHGYQELHARGSFDPEVMSVVYLINSIGKTNGMQASALAWALTFGRHLIPQEPREQVYMVRRAGNSISLTPVKGNGDGDGVAYAGSMLQRGMEMMAKKGERKMLGCCPKPETWTSRHQNSEFSHLSQSDKCSGKSKNLRFLAGFGTASQMFYQTDRRKK